MDDNQLLDTVANLAMIREHRRNVIKLFGPARWGEHKAGVKPYIEGYSKRHGVNFMSAAISMADRVKDKIDDGTLALILCVGYEMEFPDTLECGE